ncbi:MAG: AIPR family protein [Clostridia bacterium]|nr:AIPR family protein [Clostridia bacterium]
MKNLDKYINYIETVLINKNIDNEETEWKHSSELAKLLNTSEDIYIADSLSTGIDASELLLLIKINSDTVSENLIANIKKEIDVKIQDLASRINDEAKKDCFKTINLLFFVSTIQLRLSLKNSFSPKNLTELIKKIKTGTGVKKFKFNPVFYLDKDISTDEIKLPNIRRYEMVTLPPFDVDIEVPKDNKKSTLKGYVFTANLFDLVSLYNTIGDQLFKKNVRLGIDDKLDVDKSIKETLTDKPETFWFRNNGITILVEDAEMKLDRVGEIVLKEAENAELKFSVINGAQTITAASEYYYSLSDKERADKSSTAKVIVKIIHIREDDSESARKEAKNISISLNRQKPIKAEDIAFTNEFVEIMNDYLESSKSEYTLVRRGEDFSSNKTYSLINFAKARKACSGDPGPARSNATATLLKINTETSQFHDKEIFRQEWYSATESEKEDCYKRFYAPVLFAMDLASSCQSIAKKTKLVGVEGNVMKNGMWYFIAYVVFLLNDGNDSDYSHFTYSCDKVSPEALKLLFEDFADFYCKKLKATESDTISNAFKTSDNYKKLKECRYKGTSFYQNVCDLFDKKENVSYDEIIGMSSPSLIRPSPYPSTGMQVIYKGVPHNVSNRTEAFIYTVQQCLENASIDRYLIAMETLPFLSKNDSLDSGNFRQKAPVTVKKETIYIGKHSNSAEKLKQVTRLCDVLRIKPQTILWRNDDSIIFEY